MNICVWGLLSHVLVLYSPFIGWLLAEDTGSRGGDHGGSPSYSSLGMCLHHGGYWLGGAERAAYRAGNKAIGQNNPWVKEKMNYKKTTGHWSTHYPCCCGWCGILPVITGFRFRLRLLLLSDNGCLLNSLCGNWCRRVKALHSYRCGLNALCSDRCRLDPLGADLCRLETDSVHCHQLHGVQVDGGCHAHSSLGGQCWTRSLWSNFLRGKKNLK